MVCCYQDATSVDDLRAAFSSDGVTWNETPADDVVHQAYTASDWWGEHVYRNVIYWFSTADSGSSPARFLILNSYDPATQNFSQIVSVGGSGQPESDFNSMAAATTFKGKHYCISKQDATNRGSLYEISAGAFNLKGALFTEAGTGIIMDANAKWALFTSGQGTTDGPRMYAFGMSARGTASTNTTPPADLSNNRGWWCYQIDGDGVGPFTFTDITQAVVPASLRSNNANSQVFNTAHMGVYYDRVNDKHLLYVNNSGDNTNIWSVYDWNGPSTLIGNNGSPNDQGGDASNAMSFDQTGSGSRNWEEDQINIVIEDRVPIEDGERISFTLHGGEGQGTAVQQVKLQGWYNDEDHQALTQATLSNVGPTGTMNGTTAEELDVDDGATTYTIDWNTTTDGLAKGQPVRRQFRIFV
jgi:hypothetical protein